MPSPSSAGRARAILGPAILILLAPLIALSLALYLGYGLVLLFAIWLRWLPRGKRLLFVYW